MRETRAGERERDRYSVTGYPSMLSILYCILLSAATKPYENHLLNNCCVYCAIVNKFALIICVILIKVHNKNEYSRLKITHVIQFDTIYKGVCGRG